jgi:hypothetical protein
LLLLLLLRRRRRHASVAERAFVSIATLSHRIEVARLLLGGRPLAHLLLLLLHAKCATEVRDAQL